MVCFAAGIAGNGVESNGNAQEDYDSMEKDDLVAKLKQVGLGCDVSYAVVLLCFVTTLSTFSRLVLCCCGL